MASIPKPILGWIRQYVTGQGAGEIANTDAVVVGADSVPSGEFRIVAGEYTVDGELEVNGLLKNADGGANGSVTGDGSLTGSGVVR